MARPRKPKPDYCHHKASDRAFVTLDGRRIYLGRYDAQESRDVYDRVIGEWIARGRRPEQTEPKGDEDQPPAGITITGMLAAFWRWGEAYYVALIIGPDGRQVLNADGTPATRPTGELDNFKLALSPLRRLYGTTPAAGFGPLALKAVREEMLKPRQVRHPATGHVITKPGWCRNTINRQIKRIRQVFQWAVGEGLIPASTHHALLAVRSLKKGRGGVRESRRILPVSDERVAQTIPFLSPMVRAMVDVQRLTGARPGEVCRMRWLDIAKGDRIWTYRPIGHKTEHHDIERVVGIGPKAQAILSKFHGDDPTAFIFSPAESESWHRERRRLARKTDPTYGNRPGTNRKRAPKRKPGDCFDVASYRRAIVRACEKAFGMPAECMAIRDDLPRPGDTQEQLRAKAARRHQRSSNRAAWHRRHAWHPNQLRHTTATTLRKEYGIEASKAVLGHTSVETTQIYAEKDAELAERVISEVG